MRNFPKASARSCSANAPVITSSPGRTSDPPKKLDPQIRLDAACDEAVERLKGKEVSRKAISLPEGNAGRELILKTKDGKKLVIDRMYLNKGRLHQLIASGPKWWIESGEVRKVMSSFRLLEP